MGRSILRRSRFPKGFQVLVPHRKGLDIKYKTPDAGKNTLYEERLYGGIVLVPFTCNADSGSPMNAFDLEDHTPLNEIYHTLIQERL